MDIVDNFLQNWHWLNLLLIPGLIVAFTIHELGHSLMAYFLGDVSQVKEGNITFNPIKHVSWMGIFLFMLFGFGWAKPLRFNTKYFKDRYLDSFLVAMAGPTANFITSAILFLFSAVLVSLIRLGNGIDMQTLTTILFFGQGEQLASMQFEEALQHTSVWIIAFTNRVWVANFLLAFMSLIPLPLPSFDGFTAILSLIGLVKERRINQLTGKKSADYASTVLQGEATEEQSDENASKKNNIVDIHFQLGTQYHQNQQFDDAIARYRLALKADDTFGPAYVNMGLAYKAKDMRQEAIQALRGATTHAADEKSKNQAWVELHHLSAIPNSPLNGQFKDENSGTAPWTDIKPAPDWILFWTSAILFISFFSCIVGLLMFRLVNIGM